MKLRARKPGGWTTIEMPDSAEAIGVGSGKIDGQLCFTLTAKREDAPHITETGILDVDGEHEPLLSGNIPRTDDGTSIVLDRLLPD